MCVYIYSLVRKRTAIPYTHAHIRRRHVCVCVCVFKRGREVAVGNRYDRVIERETLSLSLSLSLHSGCLFIQPI